METQSIDLVLSKPGIYGNARPLAAGERRVKECKRHRRGELAGRMPVDTQDGRIWAVAESHFCIRCGATMEPRLVKGTIRRTQRAALEAYGLPAEDIAGFFPQEAPPAAGDRPAMALTCWPFPVSTYYPRPQP